MAQTTTTSNSNLRYFTSVSVPVEFKETFTQLEDILQTEHGSDGSHRIATAGQSGFVTPEHIQKLEEMWNWFRKEQDKQS